MYILWIKRTKRNGKIVMAQKTKDFKNLNCKVDIKVSDELEKFIEETKLSKTATVEKQRHRTRAGYRQG